MEALKRMEKHNIYVIDIFTIEATNTAKKKKSISEIIMLQRLHVSVLVCLCMPVIAQIQSVLLISSRCVGSQIRK